MSLNLAVVHPLVLLSVVDHFNRSNLKRKQKKRVIGALLGEISGSKVEVSNCYALPFDEEDKESNVWFVDHLFHERMLKMFKKINAKEKFVGWYSTGTRFLPQDVHIFEVFRKYASKQVYLVVDV
jgi:26S proteasome regulatory subunit N8